jgi:hypothetical protein
LLKIGQIKNLLGSSDENRPPNDGSIASQDATGTTTGSGAGTGSQSTSGEGSDARRISPLPSSQQLVPAVSAAPLASVTTSGERSREDDAAPTPASCFVYTEGKYFEVPDAALDDLHRLLDLHGCEEIRPPQAIIGQEDEEDGIGGHVRAIVAQTIHSSTTEAYRYQDSVRRQRGDETRRTDTVITYPHSELRLQYIIKLSQL